MAHTPVSSRLSLSHDQINARDVDGTFATHKKVSNRQHSHHPQQHRTRLTQHGHTEGASLTRQPHWADKENHARSTHSSNSRSSSSSHGNSTLSQSCSYSSSCSSQSRSRSSQSNSSCRTFSSTSRYSSYSSVTSAAFSTHEQVSLTAVSSSSRSSNSSSSSSTVSSSHSRSDARNSRASLAAAAAAAVDGAHEPLRGRSAERNVQRCVLAAEACKTILQRERALRQMELDLLVAKENLAGVVQRSVSHRRRRQQQGDEHDDVFRSIKESKNALYSTILSPGSLATKSACNKLSQQAAHNDNGIMDGINIQDAISIYNDSTFGRHTMQLPSQDAPTPMSDHAGMTDLPERPEGKPSGKDDGCREARKRRSGRSRTQRSDAAMGVRAYGQAEVGPSDSAQRRSRHRSAERHARTTAASCATTASLPSPVILLLPNAGEENAHATVERVSRVQQTDCHEMIHAGHRVLSPSVETSGWKAYLVDTEQPPTGSENVNDGNNSDDDDVRAERNDEDAKQEANASQLVSQHSRNSPTRVECVTAMHQQTTVRTTEQHQPEVRRSPCISPSSSSSSSASLSPRLVHPMSSASRSPHSATPKRVSATCSSTSQLRRSARAMAAVNVDGASEPIFAPKSVSHSRSRSSSICSNRSSIRDSLDWHGEHDHGMARHEKKRAVETPEARAPTQIITVRPFSRYCVKAPNMSAVSTTASSSMPVSAARQIRNMVRVINVTPTKKHGHTSQSRSQDALSCPDTHSAFTHTTNAGNHNATITATNNHNDNDDTSSVHVAAAAGHVSNTTVHDNTIDTTTTTVTMSTQREHATLPIGTREPLSQLSSHGEAAGLTRAAAYVQTSHRVRPSASSTAAMTAAATAVANAGGTSANAPTAFASVTSVQLQNACEDSSNKWTRDAAAANGNHMIMSNAAATDLHDMSMSTNTTMAIASEILVTEQRARSAFNDASVTPPALTVPLPSSAETLAALIPVKTAEDAARAAACASLLGAENSQHDVLDNSCSNLIEFPSPPQDSAVSAIFKSGAYNQVVLPRMPDLPWNSTPIDMTRLRRPETCTIAYEDEGCCENCDSFDQCTACLYYYLCCAYCDTGDD